jgi:hypothetical protein
MTDTTLELAERQIHDCPTIRVPLTGVVVDLTEPHEVVQALEDIRAVKIELENVRRLFEGALILESKHQGTKTLHLGNLDAVISGGPTSQFDTELLQEGLRAAGLPEDRLAKAVEQTVSYKPKQLVLKQLAGANPDYAAAIDAARTIVETALRVTVKPAGGHL